MKIQKISALHSDARGNIIALFDLVNDPDVRSVLVITSEKGAIRANHYHKKDRHYTYLLSGSFEYTEQVQDKPETKEVYLVKPGDMVQTDPPILHAMRFLEASVMVVLTTEDRAPEAYERDTVRVTLI